MRNQSHAGDGKIMGRSLRASRFVENQSNREYHPQVSRATTMPISPANGYPGQIDVNFKRQIDELKLLHSTHGTETPANVTNTNGHNDSLCQSSIDNSVDIDSGVGIQARCLTFRETHTGG